MYGPTVVITTLADSASERIDPASDTSASSNGNSACPEPSRSLTPSSFDRLRPASAHFVPGSACSARYSAVSAPVNPVAPNRMTSYSRSAIGPDATRRRQRVLGRDPGPRRHPAGDRRRHPLGGVRGLPCEIEQGAELRRCGRLGPELFRVRGDPLPGVHGEARTLAALP